MGFWVVQGPQPRCWRLQLEALNHTGGAAPISIPDAADKPIADLELVSQTGLLTLSVLTVPHYALLLPPRGAIDAARQQQEMNGHFHLNSLKRNYKRADNLST